MPASHRHPALGSVLLLVLVCSTILPSGVVAQAPLRRGGMDLRLFRPAIDSKGLLGVDGSDVLGAGDISFGLVLDAGLGLLPFDGFENDSTRNAGDAERVDHLVDQLFTGTLHLNYGVANLAAIGVELPVYVASGPDVTVPGQYDDRATTAGLDSQGASDLVLHGKLRLTRFDRDPVGMALIARVGIPIGDEAAFGGEPGPWVWPTAVLEWRPTRGLRLALDVGYRLIVGDGATIRVGGRTLPSSGNATSAVFSPVDSGTDVTHGDQLTFRAGASLRVADAVDLVAEAHGAQILGQIGDRGALSVEALGGLKIFVERNSYLMLGAGAGLTDGVSAPDVRGVLGFVFEPSIGDRDGDGLRDDTDACPNEPEDFDDFVDADGCPDPDNDRDQILDVDDECPLVPEDRDGDADEDGCPEGNEGDRDGDRILDMDDTCPDDPEDWDGFQDEEGCPDLDNDEDQILDSDDLCPNDPEDTDDWGDTDGCPDPDNDSDRILDVDDACPNRPEHYNGFEDEDGCPDTGIIDFEDDVMVLLEKIYFETDSARILPRSYRVLDAIAGALAGNPHILLVEIQGHADERASDEYNLRLTRDRAAAVRLALADRGIDPSRMRSAGYGERCPEDPRHNPRAWETNRRVEIKILRYTSGPSGVQVACPAGRELIPR